MNTNDMPLVLVTYLNMTNLPQPWKLAPQPSCQPYDLHEMSEHPIEEYKDPYNNLGVHPYPTRFYHSILVILV